MAYAGSLHILHPRDDSDESSEVVTWVKGTYVTEYCFLALAMLVFWDTACTMDKEVKYFWTRTKDFTVTKLVFFTNRYLGMLGSFTILGYNTFNSSRPLCLFSGVTRDIANYFIILSIDYVLLIRVLALYSRERRLSIILYLFFTLNAAIEIATTTSIAYLQHTDFGELAPGIVVCGADFVPPTWVGIISWITPLVYGLILLVLAMHKAAEFWKLSKNLRGFRLVRVLLLDQAMYFCLMISCCFFNLLQYRVSSNIIWSQVLSCLGSPTLLCILGSRMMFSLREAAERGVHIGTNAWTADIEDSEQVTLTDMRFTSTGWKGAQISPVTPAMGAMNGETPVDENSSEKVKGKMIKRDVAEIA